MELRRSTHFLVLALLIPGEIGVSRRAPISTPHTREESGNSFHAAVGLTDRIQQVENGLRPPVIVKGRPVTMNLADRMKHYNTPGVSLAVINDNKIEWARGYGALEAGGDRAVTTETLFQAASISKPVTAMAALRLVQQGKLALDEDVNRKLISWKIPENEFTKDQKITLRRLLSHSAGLTVHGFAGYAAEEAAPTTIEILDGIKPANSAPVQVNVTPGTQSRYSGGGYVVLQLLLTEVTGKSFPEVMKELVFSKIDMRHSTYQQPLPKEWAPAAATAHRISGEPVKGKWHTYPEMAAAGLWTTASDLARFAIELQLSKAGKSNQVLSASMTHQMLTPQIADVGLGLFISGKARATSFSHGGSNQGFRCQLFAYTESGQGAVVMTNAGQGDLLAQEILRSIAKEYGWPDYQVAEHVLAKVNPAIYEAYAGVYEVRPGYTIAVTVEPGKLFIQATGRPRFEILPETETKFFRLDRSDMLHSFVKDQRGKVTEFVTETGGQSIKAKRIN